MLWLIIVSPFLLDTRKDGTCETMRWVNKEAWGPVYTFVGDLCSTSSKEAEAISNAWSDGIRCWPEGQHSPWCTDYRKKEEACIENMMEALGPYMAPEEKFISDFMIRGHNVTIEQLCNDAEESIEEKVSKINKLHCEKDIGELAMNGISKCIPESEFFQGMKDINLNAVMNKSDFCSNLRTTTKCIIDYLEAHCTGRAFSSFLDGIFEALLDWCNKNV